MWIANDADNSGESNEPLSNRSTWPNWPAMLHNEVASSAQPSALGQALRSWLAGG